MATARTEAERLWVWRENGFMRVAATRPAGIACTEYAKVKEIGANAKAAGEPEPVKTTTAPAKKKPGPKKRSK